jgi:hypothetical protein
MGDRAIKQPTDGEDEAVGKWELLASRVVGRAVLKGRAWMCCTGLRIRECTT